jgi:hypothetical protein
MFKMGRKYLGKFKGETRSPCEQALLAFEPKNEKEAHELDNKVDKYFHGIGYSIVPPNKNDYYAHNAFHVAGASICISTMYKNYPPSVLNLGNTETDKKCDYPKHYVQLNLMSSQGFVDIIVKIKGKFPVFKELALKDQVLP